METRSTGRRSESGLGSLDYPLPARASKESKQQKSNDSGLPEWLTRVGRHFGGIGRLAIGQDDDGRAAVGA
jgi:hypothetical protein